MYILNILKFMLDFQEPQLQNVVMYMRVKVTQSCLTLLQPHGLWPARLLCPWSSPGKNTGVAISSSRGSSQFWDWTWVSWIAGGFFTIWATKEASKVLPNSQFLYTFNESCYIVMALKPQVSALIFLLEHLVCLKPLYFCHSLTSSWARISYFSVSSEHSTMSSTY